MLKVLLIAFILLSPAVPARAQPDTPPAISGALSIELQNDWAYQSGDRANQSNDLYTTVEPSVAVRLSPSWSLFAHAVLEPVTPPEQFENRVFGDHGLYMEDLFVEYAPAPFYLRAGKMNVGFGIAWDEAPGIYGRDFAEDGYETAERIGVGGGWTIDAAGLGRHRVSAATFFLDTTILSQSVLRGRGDTRRRDGGVSNTEDFSSYIVALNGARIGGMANLGYHVAYMHQAKGEGDASSEDSAALAVFGNFALGEGVAVFPLVEYVHQDNPGGAADEDRDFLTLAGQLEWKGYNVATAWTWRRTHNAVDQDDYQFQVSAGYAFDFGLTIDVGWKVAEEAKVETRTLGAIATYSISF